MAIVLFFVWPTVQALSIDDESLKKKKKTKPFGEFSWWYSTARFRKDGWATTPSPHPTSIFLFYLTCFCADIIQIERERY